jgi:ectoine hydroxylase-related dioxygenase (phytanoyl-CoA dioxygenase family)
MFKEAKLMTNPDSQRLSTVNKYPIEADGYAMGCWHNDPIGIDESLSQFGFVVIKEVIDHDLIDYCKQRISFWKELIGERADKEGLKGLSRGFLEVYHDDFLAQVRQSPKLIEAHQHIWQTHKLWVSYDRVVLKPGLGESASKLPLHVDQNPSTHPGFCCTQGLISISNCTVLGGTTWIVPGSYRSFANFASIARAGRQYIEILDAGQNTLDHFQSNAISIPIRPGDALIWDSRTAHTNGDNLSGHDRMAVLVSYQPVNEYRPVQQIRLNAFKKCESVNYRLGRMHASSLPRFNDSEFMREHRIAENLTELGSLVYGIKEYN